MVELFPSRLRGPMHGFYRHYLGTSAMPWVIEDAPNNVNLTSETNDEEQRT